MKHMKQILMADGTRKLAQRTKDGDIVSGSKSPQDSRYFGEYLGADEFGIEPIFKEVA
jgi:hypothetical protein